MKLVSFCFLTVLSLVYAGLTMAETMTYHKWEKAAIEQRYIQAEVGYFDHLNSVLDEMVRRMAVVSQHDPAMAQLLKEHNINVIIESPNAPPTPSTPNGFDVVPPVNPSSAPTDKPDQSPGASAPMHP